jgi:hypothetical protein
MAFGDMSYDAILTPGRVYVNSKLLILAHGFVLGALATLRWTAEGGRPHMVLSPPVLIGLW